MPQKLTAVTELSQVCPRNKKNSENDVLEAILGHVGQREDCDDDGVDASVGVDVGAVVVVDVHGQGVYLGVSLGVGLDVGSPTLTHQKNTLAVQ